MLRKKEDMDLSIFSPDTAKKEDKDIVEEVDIGLFDIIKDIQYEKKGILNEREAKAMIFPSNKYPAYVVNKILGNSADCVLYANEMNRLSHMPIKNQYNFLLQSILKRKRFSKSYKADKNHEQEITDLMLYFKWGKQEAEQNIHMFKPKELKELHKLLNPENK